MVFIYYSITAKSAEYSCGTAEFCSFKHGNGNYPAALKKRGKVLVGASKTTLQHSLNISCVIKGVNMLGISESSWFFLLSTVLMSDLVK